MKRAAAVVAFVALLLGQALADNGHRTPIPHAASGLPNQAGHAGQFLTTNGTAASWANSSCTQSTAVITNNYSAAAGDCMIYFNFNAKTITLPTGVAEKVITVKDVSGGNSFVGWVQGSGGQLIDGRAKYILGGAYTQQSFRFDATAGAWHTVATTLQGAFDAAESLNVNRTAEIYTKGIDSFNPAGGLSLIEGSSGFNQVPWPLTVFNVQGALGYFRVVGSGWSTANGINDAYVGVTVANNINGLNGPLNIGSVNGANGTTGGVHIGTTTNGTVPVSLEGPTTATQGFTSSGGTTLSSLVNAVTGVFNLAAAQTAGLLLANTTASTAGSTLQFSPGLELDGSAWDTTAVASSAGNWMLQSCPVSGAGIANTLCLYQKTGTGSWGLQGRWRNPGDFGASGGLYANGFNGNGSVFAATFNPGAASTAMNICSNVNCSGITIGSTNGNVTIGSSLALSGLLRPHRTTVNDANYTISFGASGDTMVVYTAISAARVVSIGCASGFSANSAPEFYVKDESGSASGTNTITVTATSGTIDGVASITCVNSARGKCHFYSNGTNCFTL